MLPFALKVVWFILSFTGTIACWTVLICFRHVVGSMFGPAMYGVFVTIQQGIFCLGMIWEMDSYKMPRSFCLVQTFMVYYTSYSLTGVCAAFTFVTAGWVLWPSSMIDPGKLPLRYQHKHCLPIFVFPLGCLAIAVPIILKLDAIQPADGMGCDASYPVWSRFLGYAGLPLLLSIPCFFLSATAVFRVYQMHRQSHSRNFFLSDEQLAVMDFPSPPPSPPPTQLLVKGLQPGAKIEASLPHFGLEGVKDVTLNLTADDASSGLVGTEHSWLGSSSGLSSCPFAVPSTPPDVREWDPNTLVDQPDGEEVVSPRQRSTDSNSWTNCIGPSLAPAIWRLLLFQLVFFLIEILASLSTIIDVAQHRASPSAFGTQHIALILDAWGPLIVFGQLPAIREGLIFWRRRQPSS